MASIRLPQVLSLLLISLCLGACSGSGGDSTATLGPTAASFPSSAYTLLVGVPVEQTSNARPNVSGDAQQWSVAPSLPAGLSLDSASGTIQGTPSATSERSAYTITAQGHGISVSTLIQLGVARPARQSLLAGADGSLTAYAVDAANGRLTAQRQQYTAFSELEEVLASPIAPVFYALAGTGTSGAPSLIALALDSSGEFQIMVEVPVVQGPNTMGLSADGRTLIVASNSSGTLVSYLIDPLTGLPSPGASSIAPAPDANAMAVDPLGRFVFVLSKINRSVIVLELDTGSGVFTDLGTPFELAGIVPQDLVISPDGNNLYLTTESFDFVLGLAIDPTSGSMTVVNSQVTGGDPTRLSMHPEGLALVVSDPTASLIRVLPRDVQSGLLGQAGAGVSVGQDARPSFDESGLLLWVLDDTGNLASFQVNPANGALTSGSSFGGSAGSIGLASLSGDGPLERDLTALYALNRNAESISLYGPDGPQGAYQERGLPVPTGADPVALAVRPGGRLLAVANRGDDTITLVELDADGDPQASAIYTAAGSEPSGLVFDLTGHLLIVARAGTSEVSTFAVDVPNLNLVPVDTRLVGGTPEHLALSDNGHFLVIADTDGERLIVLRVEDGVFAGPTQATPAGGVPGQPTILADGRTVLLPLTDTSSVQAFVLNAQNGMPALLGTSLVTGAGPTAIAVHPSGRWAYSTNSLAMGNGTVQLFDLDEAAGSLSPRNQIAAGTTPRAILAGPAGKLLFVANSAAASLSIFSVGQDGNLSGQSTLTTDTTPWRLGSVISYR